MQRIEFETEDGAGEAVKLGRDEPWHVAAPTVDFRWYGSVPEIKKKIESMVGGVLFSD